MFLLDYALALVLGLLGMIPVTDDFTRAQQTLDNHKTAADVLAIRNDVIAAYTTRNSFSGLTAAVSVDSGLIESTRGPGGSTLDLYAGGTNDAQLVIDLSGLTNPELCRSLVQENAWAWDSVEVDGNDLLNASLPNVVNGCEDSERVVLRAS